MKKIKCGFPESKCPLLRKIDKNPICAAIIEDGNNCKSEILQEIKNLDDKITHLNKVIEEKQTENEQNPTDELKDEIDKLKDKVEQADFEKGCLEDQLENGDYKGSIKTEEEEE